MAGFPGSVSSATTATRWVSLPIRENSCHSWFHLKAWFFREGWRIFNHEWARMGRGRSITDRRSITDLPLYLDAIRAVACIRFVRAWLCVDHCVAVGVKPTPSLSEACSVCVKNAVAQEPKPLRAIGGGTIGNRQRRWRSKTSSCSACDASRPPT